MIAEPVPLVPMDDGNFTSDATTTVVLGECRCPGRPHTEDTAEVLLELPWDVLIEAGALFGAAEQAGNASASASFHAKGYRALVLGCVVAWNVTDAEGDPVPISMAGKLRQERMGPIIEAVNATYERAKAPLPNASGAPSRRSRRESASPNPTIRPRAKRTR
jgi:hypothetical protein